MVNAFGPPRRGCIRWDSNGEPGMVAAQNHDGGRVAARAVTTHDVLIGSLFISLRSFFSTRDGVMIGQENDQEIERLWIDAACPLPWLSYTAGDQLPLGVVTGGRLADGSPIYMAKIIHDGHIAFGYYDPKTAQAYYDYAAAQTTTSMYLLVLLWLKEAEWRIDVSANLTVIGSDNGGVPPTRCQAIICTNVWLVENWTLGNKFQWNLNKNKTIFTREKTTIILCRYQWLN